MKLSQFKNTGVTKKLVFANGEAQIIETANIIDGEISFYDLSDANVIKSINDNVIQKLKGNESDAEVTYMCFAYLSDIEVDINLDEFLQMFEKPSSQFAKVLEVFISSLNDIFEKAETLNRTSEKMKTLNEKLPNMQEELFKLKQEEIEKLYEELSQCKNNPTRRKEILTKLQELGD